MFILSSFSDLRDDYLKQTDWTQDQFGQGWNHIFLTEQQLNIRSL